MRGRSHRNDAPRAPAPARLPRHGRSNTALCSRAAHKCAPDAAAPWSDTPRRTQWRSSAAQPAHAPALRRQNPGLGRSSRGPGARQSQRREEWVDALIAKSFQAFASITVPFCAFAHCPALCSVIYPYICKFLAQKYVLPAVFARELAQRQPTLAHLGFLPRAALAPICLAADVFLAGLLALVFQTWIG